MKMRFVVASMLAALSMGCAFYQAGVVSKQGKAYVIKNEGWGQSVLLCDATGGAPHLRPPRRPAD